MKATSGVFPIKIYSSCTAGLARKTVDQQANLCGPVATLFECFFKVFLSHFTSQPSHNYRITTLRLGAESRYAGPWICTFLFSFLHFKTLAAIIIPVIFQ